MPFPFACPECGLETLVDDEFSGHSGPCAGCGKVITVPYQAVSHTTYQGPPLSPWSQRQPAEPPAKRGVNTPTILLIVASSIVAALFVFGAVLWLVFPALRGVTTGVQKMSCRSNLERIAAAIKLYEIEHGSLPPAFIPDAKGKPMHSWRVLILPQLGERGLHDRYNFNEPWDGPNNLALVAQMPEVFACPADPDARSKGETSYMVIVGPGTLFPGKSAVSSRMVRDDHALTILVAETPAAGTVWTQPKDLDATRMKFAINGSMSGEIASLHGGTTEGANVVTLDGRAHFLTELFSDQFLEAMSTASGGEDVPLESLSQ